jgi:hypothetical protein
MFMFTLWLCLEAKSDCSFLTESPLHVFLKLLLKSRKGIDTIKAGLSSEVSAFGLISCFGKIILQPSLGLNRN